MKTLNKRSQEVDASLKSNNRIHESITAHDSIINTYTRKISKPSTTNRAELIFKLKANPKFSHLRNQLLRRVARLLEMALKILYSNVNCYHNKSHLIENIIEENGISCKVFVASKNGPNANIKYRA